MDYFPLNSFKLDEISYQDEDFLPFNDDPFNIKYPSKLSENNDFRNDMLSASFAYDYYNENDDNNIRNKIDDFTQDVNKPEKKMIFGTTKVETKEKTSFPGGDKTLTLKKELVNQKQIIK